MRAGKLRDRAEFRRKGESDDGYGNVTSGEPVAFLTVWSDVMERPGGERLAAGAMDATRMATIRVRRSSETVAVKASDIVSARGQLWNIRAIAGDARGEWIEFTCEAGVAT